MHSRTLTRFLALAALIAAGCSGGEPLETVRGVATFYSDRFEGRTTASGTTFSQSDLVAAHRSYPFGTALRVINLENDQSVRVEVVDRGPYSTPNTIIDLSRSAAEEIGLDDEGRVPVEIEVLEWGDGETSF
jgi:rare lipoprotein A